jgi:hypothetical protein
MLHEYHVVQEVIGYGGSDPFPIVVQSRRTSSYNRWELNRFLRYELEF